ncbi:Rhamnogalacturonate lyase family protein, putative [Theobroma cacao]|uniref:rhamnogalacturonan endolyase n=1 Tax=Theobroma cacao TaxID=3641 RepID=A0A061DHD3_THECC|nr:Rhamnogalacturonate lyase family protein, putative [Theobroma cacao]
MEKVVNRSHLRQLVFWLLTIIELLLLLSASSEQLSARKLLREDTTDPLQVQLETSDDNRVVIDNGLVQVTIGNPNGYLIGLKYKGFDNVLESRNKDQNKGYWDIVWDDNAIDKIETEQFKVITQTDDLVELSFSKTWNYTTDYRKAVPLNIDKRYIVRRGVSGVYMYGIFERLAEFPAAQMYQIRIAFKLQEDKFRFMALSDTRQRVMPMGRDRNSDRSQTLAFKEAVLLTNPTDPRLKGEVDDKYQYSCENKDNKLHGWIAEPDDNPAVGFWVITPSNEFRTGGPHHQDLTSHAGPTALSMFVSTHYTGKDIETSYNEGEPWKKVFGPVLIYLNSASKDARKTLWEDAKRQLNQEIESWPYNFTGSEDFPNADGRGKVSGQLLVRDRYMDNELMQAQSAFVGLAPPGEAGSWQTEGKGYQFWTQTDENGRFKIENVRPGEYNLYAWVPGFIGNYKSDLNITIEPGKDIKLGTLIYDPPRNGPTLWEIGIPDRTAAEFYVPDPYPTLMNSICIDDVDRYRQYGLWERYSDIYRHGDLVYTVGVSNYSRDWFYAHVTRDGGNSTKRPTTWQIKYNLEDVSETGNYTLQLALASASYAEVQVRFNYSDSDRPYFTTRLIGSDNAVARHGIHGLYRLYSIIVPGNQFQKGENKIFLSQTRSTGAFDSVMYDYIRLEGPTS